MCTWRDNDPNDASKGKTKTSDCNYCGCSTSQYSGRHSDYSGKCIQCGAPTR